MTIVTPDNLQAIRKCHHRITQQHNGGFTEEIETGAQSADVLMIAGNGIDAQGCLQTIQLLLHPLLHDRNHIMVNQIPSDQDQIGLLPVDQLHIAGQLRLVGCIA